MLDILAGREIIFEFRSAGPATQVGAIDCESGTEVFVTTPAGAMRIDQQNLALRKLAKALIDNDVIPALPSKQENSGKPQGSPLLPNRGFLA